MKKKYREKNAVTVMSRPVNKLGNLVVPSKKKKPRKKGGMKK